MIHDWLSDRHPRPFLPFQTPSCRADVGAAAFLSMVVDAAQHLFENDAWAQLLSIPRLHSDFEAQYAAGQAMDLPTLTIPDTPPVSIPEGATPAQARGTFLLKGHVCAGGAALLVWGWLVVCGVDFLCGSCCVWVRWIFAEAACQLSALFFLPLAPLPSTPALPAPHPSAHLAGGCAHARGLSAARGH
jgi:hypothetical protein